MHYLDSENYPCKDRQQARELDNRLADLLACDYRGDFYDQLARYQRILADNRRKNEWPAMHEKLHTLFLCGRAMPLDGPMIGISLSLRDSDFFGEISKNFNGVRTAIAGMEILATLWNSTLADTGIWMGKTFEPVSHEMWAQKCSHHPAATAAYDSATCRLGRNFFRDTPDSRFQALPLITQAWHLKDRPDSSNSVGFEAALLAENIEKEAVIPYSKTGGYYLAALYPSVLDEGKTVYALNYRWPALNPAFPMSCLIDEVVQIHEGIYLGQLIYATRHYSTGKSELPFIPVELGEPYSPDGQDYGYQNNGYFLMMDPVYASRIYAAFPQLRPREFEAGYTGDSPAGQENPAPAPKRSSFEKKFTTLFTPTAAQLQQDESVLQMLQRTSRDILAQSDSSPVCFDPLHRLFLTGIAPVVNHGLFQGRGAKGYNIRLEGQEYQDWYGEAEVAHGFDYYHGIALNLRSGFDRHEAEILPGLLALRLTNGELSSPNLPDLVWHNLAQYIFPWAGKCFEKIPPRKLSMLVDESANLAYRYPARASQLKFHLASAPHYFALSQNAAHPRAGRYAAHLAHAWDQGMSDEDKQFWAKEADERYVMGYNLQDKRILSVDALMSISDLNYRTPDAVLQRASVVSGSPFSRQGYAFLGVADQTSILPINRGRRVFQFNYRYPMIGGPAPIGYCLDELVEIADGLFLGQLIYATALALPYHSATDPARYDYRLFGYFLLMDDEWEKHRQAIGFD